MQKGNFKPTVNLPSTEQITNKIAPMKTANLNEAMPEIG
jgi:hypothetical protein